MIELLSSPFAPVFAAFCDGVRQRCLICSPYVTQSQVQRLVQSAQHNNTCKYLQCEIITDISAANVMSGNTDLDALIWWHQQMPQMKFTYLPRVHAKVLLRDGNEAIIGSANFTQGGAWANREYGVRLRDEAQIQQIERDMAAYALLGSLVPLSRLETLRDALAPLKIAAVEARQKQRETLSAATEKVAALQRVLEDALLRARTAQRSVNATFEITILHLLQNAPCTTETLHENIKALHPDFCDDELDRVIDGQHFGKLWKHGVRNAQQSLKRKGAIEYESETRLWKHL